MSDLNRSLRERRFSKRNGVFAMLGAVALIGWPYVLLTNNAFMVNTVEVRGVKSLDPVDVTRTALTIIDNRGEWRPWPARHAWFINADALKKQLMERLFVSNVIVDKSYNNVLRLSIEERSKKVIFHSHQQYYWVDLQGVATEELSKDEKKDAQSRLLGTRAPVDSDIPIIKQDLDDPISQGFQIADQRRSREWIKLAEDLKSYNLVYREIEPPTASSTLFKVLSQDGYNVVMDITSPLDLQVHTYQGFMKAKPSDLKPLDYVDVRVPGRVYLKER